MPLVLQYIHISPATSYSPANATYVVEQDGLTIRGQLDEAEAAQLLEAAEPMVNALQSIVEVTSKSPVQMPGTSGSADTTSADDSPF